MDRKLQVVPGGTSGMGLATAVALGKFGPVLVGGRNEKRLESALKTLKEAGVEAYGKQLDISDRESMKAFAEYAAGKVDQLAQRAVVLDQPRGHCFALVRDRAGKHQHLHRVDERRILPDARPAEIQLSGF